MQNTSSWRSHPAGYEIRIQGHLDARWTAQLDGMNLVVATDGTTVIAGPVVDQAALHGLLTRLHDLGLPLLSVNTVGAPGLPVAGQPSATIPLDTTSQGH